MLGVRLMFMCLLLCLYIMSFHICITIFQLLTTLMIMVRESRRKEASNQIPWIIRMIDFKVFDFALCIMHYLNSLPLFGRAPLRNLILNN